VAVDDYRRASEISILQGAKGLSRQSFSLLKKTREIDDFCRGSPVLFYEVHPELSFARLNAGVPSTSEKSWAGVMARRELLSQQGIVLDGFKGRDARRATRDDVLDASVCAWSARRITEGDFQRLPDPPDVDEMSREMCIRV
jgi:predicted RNase H-like nuclease